MQPFSWTDKRVVVTGGTGFIGSFLVEWLIEAGARVVVPVRAMNYRSLSARRDQVEWLEGDLRDDTYCAELVRNADHVFHLASYRRKATYHRRYSSDVINGNVQMTLSLLRGLKDQPHVPVTFFSTANVPPSLDVIALAQEEKLDGYVLGKALCESLWFAASRQRKFPLLIVRPTGTYGPRDTFARDGNVIPALMIKARDDGDKLVVWGSGRQELAFLYVKDLVSAVIHLLDNERQGVHYIVPPETVTVHDLSASIRDLIRPDLPIAFDTSRPDGERSDIRLPVDACLHGFAWTPLQQGLKETVDWWVSAR